MRDLIGERMPDEKAATWPRPELRQVDPRLPDHCDRGAADGLPVSTEMPTVVFDLMQPIPRRPSDGRRSSTSPCRTARRSAARAAREGEATMAPLDEAPPHPSANGDRPTRMSPRPTAPGTGRLPQLPPRVADERAAEPNVSGAVLEPLCPCSTSSTVRSRPCPSLTDDPWARGIGFRAPARRAASRLGLERVGARATVRSDPPRSALLRADPDAAEARRHVIRPGYAAAAASCDRPRSSSGPAPTTERAAVATHLTHPRRRTAGD